MVRLAGMVSTVKMSSLKHRVPCNLSAVLDTYTESPRKDGVKRFDAPAYEFDNILQKYLETKPKIIINSKNYKIWT